MTRGDKIIKFRAVNGDIFQAIIKGKKKIETRAVIPGYMEVKVCDMLTLVCANQRIKKQVSKIEYFKTIGGALKEI